MITKIVEPMSGLTVGSMGDHGQVGVLQDLHGKAGAFFHQADDVVCGLSEVHGRPFSRETSQLPESISRNERMVKLASRAELLRSGKQNRPQVSVYGPRRQITENKHRDPRANVLLAWASYFFFSSASLS